MILACMILDGKDYEFELTLDLTIYSLMTASLLCVFTYHSIYHGLTFMAPLDTLLFLGFILMAVERHSIDKNTHFFLPGFIMAFVNAIGHLSAKKIDKLLLLGDLCLFMAMYFGLQLVANGSLSWVLPTLLCILCLSLSFSMRIYYN